MRQHYQLTEPVHDWETILRIINPNNVLPIVRLVHDRYTIDQAPDTWIYTAIEYDEVKYTERLNPYTTLRTPLKISLEHDFRSEGGGYRYGRGINGRGSVCSVTSNMFILIWEHFVVYLTGRPSTFITFSDLTDHGSKVLSGSSLFSVMKLHSKLHHFLTPKPFVVPCPQALWIITANSIREQKRTLYVSALPVEFVNHALSDDNDNDNMCAYRAIRRANRKSQVTALTVQVVNEVTVTRRSEEP